MAEDKFIVLIFTISCLCSGLSQLNLSEGSPCTTNNVNNGTCVRLFRCGSAVLTYLYRNAGFKDDKQLPELPEICSYRNDEPVVCCTDCVFSEHDEFKESAIAPYGVLVSRHGPKAWKNDTIVLAGGDTFDETIQLFKLGVAKVVASISAVGLEIAPHKNEALWFHKLPRSREQPSSLVIIEDAQIQALLGYGDTVDAAQWLCEGTVISERFILTAAHCTNAGVLGTIAYAALGLQSPVDPEEQYKVYNIKRLIIHPEYNEPSWYHNLALLETETEISFDNEILPACLDVGFRDISLAEAAGLLSVDMNETEIQINETETATKESNVTKADAIEMQTVFLDELDRIICKEVYKPHNNLIHGYDHKTQMCYGVHNNNGDTCKRVGGSPLQIDQFRCQYTVVGVTGHTSECRSPEVPDIFTRIQSYVPWIESIVWPDKD